MKNSFFITLILVLLTNINLACQQIFEDGNHWKYFTIDHVNDSLTSSLFKINGDTLINNRVYKKMYNSSNETNHQFQLMDYFFREDQDGRVFKLDSDLNEILLIDNKLTVGETYLPNPNCEFTLVKDDIKELNNNEFTKKLVFSYINTDPDYNSTFGFQWLENIGNLRFPFYGPNDYCEQITQDLPSTALGCFISHDVLIYGQESLCSDIVSEVEYIDAVNISIYPNPISENFIVELDQTVFQVAGIVISDLNGKVYYEDHSVDTNKISINSQELPSTIYVISIRFLNGRTINKKIVKI